MIHSMRGKDIIDKMAVYFEIVNSFRMIGAKMPPISYVDHVELRVLSKETKKY